MERREICIVMIAHNQSDEVQLAIKYFKMILQDILCKLVVVDNASKDGLGEWLRNQDEFPYILCEEDIENYADIVNTVVKEFAADCDLMLLNPCLLLLPGCLEALQEELYQNESIGAVCPVIKAVSWEKDFDTAVKEAAQYQERNCSHIMNFSSEAALLRGDFLEAMGEFDNTLLLPFNVVMDYSYRGRVAGFQFVKVKYAFLYQLNHVQNIYESRYEKDIDRSVLKEKWQMNYFNINPNVGMLDLISKHGEQPMDILEIGCDCGANLLYVSDRFPDARLYGAEINPAAAKIASSIATVRVADIEQRNLQFDQDRFDYILFGDVLEHLRDPEGALRYCLELLREDGRVCACIPNFMHFSVMQDLLHGNFTYQDMGLLDRTHIHMFTYKEIMKMFQRAGYQIEQVGVVNIPETPSPEQKAFVDKLMSISEGVEKYMYYAFQYIVEAKKL